MTPPIPAAARRAARAIAVTSEPDWRDDAAETVAELTHLAETVAVLRDLLRLALDDADETPTAERAAVLIRAHNLLAKLQG